MIAEFRQTPTQINQAAIEAGMRALQLADAAEEDTAYLGLAGENDYHVKPRYDDAGPTLSRDQATQLGMEWDEGFRTGALPLLEGDFTYDIVARSDLIPNRERSGKQKEVIPLGRYATAFAHRMVPIPKHPAAPMDEEPFWAHDIGHLRQFAKLFAIPGFADIVHISGMRAVSRRSRHDMIGFANTVDLLTAEMGSAERGYSIYGEAAVKRSQGYVRTLVESGTRGLTPGQYTKVAQFACRRAGILTDVALQAYRRAKSNEKAMAQHALAERQEGH